MMMTCSIGVVVVAANTGAALAEVKNAVVARHSALNRPVDVFMLISRAGKSMLRDWAGEENRSPRLATFAGSHLRRLSVLLRFYESGGSAAEGRPDLRRLQTRIICINSSSGRLALSG